MDSTLSTTAARRVVANAAGYWGGQFSDAQGETMTILVSDSYAQDPAIPQRWANYLGSLLHGSELSLLTLYLAPANEVTQTCGPGALACYNNRRSLIVAPGTDPSFDVSSEAVVVHEYGHHVAAHRSNAPWAAIDWGTKRWATAIGVCAATRANAAFPGAEDNAHYALNPGEGFAESFRVLNQRRLGVIETPWEIVSRVFYPDAARLTALEQDVASPWTSNTTTALKGAFAKTGASRREYAIATPLDGTFAVTLTARARLTLSVLNGAGKVVGQSRTTASSPKAQVTVAVCGARASKLRIARVAGSGAYILAVSKP